MKRNDLIKGVERTFKECLDKMKKKNHDYAGESDALKNFKLVDYLGIASTPQGILVRLCDKFSRIANIYQGGAQVDESVDDTIKDAINYLVILKASLKEQRGSRKYVDKGYDSH